MELVVSELKKSFAHQQVLRGASFTFQKGHIYGLLGRNGAGKTTFFNCLNGDLQTDAGSALLRKENGVERPLAYSDIGYVQSVPIVPDFLTAREFLKFFLEINRDRIRDPQSPDAYLDSVQIAAEDRGKLLRRPARRMALIMAGGLSALMIATQIFPEFSEKLRTNFMGVLPYLPMLMYFINRGETTTKILFFNCDSSLMAYSFYRSPQLIRSLFWERLRSLIHINLLPSTVLALGLPLLLLLAGGSDSPPDYLILPTSVLFLSVFFSTHYLVLYYLLQPYTQELVSKSPAYSTATLVTYWVCYFGANKMGKLISPTLLAAICIGVLLLYVLVALPLVSRLAPKTFRLRH